MLILDHAMAGVLLTLLVIAYIALVVLSVSQFKLWIEFKALQNSTHKITYLNPLSEFAKLSDDDKKKLTFDALNENI